MTLALLSLLACTAKGPSGNGGDNASGDNAAGDNGGDNGAGNGSGDNASGNGSGDNGGGGHLLTVDGGYGGGTYAAGTRVHVWSDVNPQTSIVTTWGAVPALSDPGALADVGEWNTDLVMPDADVTLTPVPLAVDVPLMDLTVTLSTGDRTVLAAIPAVSLKAIVLFFHGASYNRTELTDNAAASITRRLYNAGYGVVAMDSTRAWSSGVGGWDDDVDNPDNADLLAVRDLVAAVHGGIVGASVPIVAWGMSSGGQFAHAVGLALPTVASAVVGSCAPGRASTTSATRVPTLWMLAERDSTFPTGAADAAKAAAGMDARGVPNELDVHPATPLYDARFQRIAGIDATTSAAIAADLRAAGAVDADDAWLLTGAQVTAGMDFPSLAGLTTSQRTAVAAEIEIMAAEHELYDDYGAKMVAFLDAHH